MKPNATIIINKGKFDSLYVAEKALRYTHRFCGNN
jgi:hypothetical protein